MKTSLLITSLFLGLACTGFAAKGTKGNKGGRDKEALHAATEALKPFDKNGNKTIDGEEVAAVQKAFTEATSGPLAVLDKNKDGKLDEAELKVLRPHGALAGLIKELDKDGNRKLEGAEIEALKKKFEADPKGNLAIMDRNGDGKLGDDEIKSVTDRLAKRASAGARGKKGGDSATPAKPSSPETPKPKEGEEIKKAEPTAK